MTRNVLLLLLAIQLWLCLVCQAENIVYPDDVQAIVDVTEAPYDADPTGQRDCTAALIQAIDDVLRPDLEAMKQTLAIIKGARKDVVRADDVDFQTRQNLRRKNPMAVIGFERCSGIFPYRNAPSRILYFPNGTYLVSDTLCYSFKDLKNAIGMELNRCLHIQGQSEEGVVIRLKDQAHGFGAGSNKPVISFMHGSRSNVSMQNTCENLTIDIGRGNPGAVGLHFFANNTGAVRHVTVRSSDPQQTGRAGVAVTTFNSSCAFLQHVMVQGFDYGIEITQSRLYTVLEHIRLQGQREAGFFLEDHNVAARGILSDNQCPAVRIQGRQSTLALVDCHFTGGSDNEPAVDFSSGFLMARNIRTAGYRAAIQRPDRSGVDEAEVEEYVSHPCPGTSPEQPRRSSLKLPVKETPYPRWEQNMSQWISVNACGARGDGLTDDTKAIQRAMRAGKRVVYFQPGTYLINAPVEVPSQVERVNFMYCDLVAGEDLQTLERQGAFKVVGEAAHPLLFEDLFAFELFFGAHTLVDHASRRTVILSDLHTQVAALYQNSVSGGEAFIENVCTTDQFPPQKTCLSFRGQRVWARQLNPERADPEVLNDGSHLWVLGFKTEKSGTAFLTTNGGHSEILGGIFNISRAEQSSPAIVSRDSHVSIFASTTDHRPRPEEWNLRPFIQEIRNGAIRSLDWNAFPRRDEHLVVVPLYTGPQ